jgi:adhesin transport system outer membrane protein
MNRIAARTVSQTLATVAALILVLPSIAVYAGTPEPQTPWPGTKFVGGNTCSSADVLFALAGQPVPMSQSQVKFTLRRLLRAAVETHPSVKSARFNQQSAQSMIEASRQQFLPAFSVQSDSLSGRSATTFRLSQPLWTGGRLTADLRWAELRELRTREAISDSEIVLAARFMAVAQTYLSNHGRRLTQERNISTLTDLLRMIERRAQAEVSTVADVNLVQTRLAQAKADLEVFRALEAAALAQLGSLTDQTLNPDSLELPALPARPPMLARLLDSATRDNPRVRLGEVDVRLAAIEIDQAKSALWPTVALRVERQVGNFQGSASADNRIFVSMQYAPGSGLAVGSQITAAEQRLLAVERTAEADRRDISERVEAEWRDLESTLRRLPELKRAREGAAEALASNKRLFVTGRRSWIDLLNSVREIALSEQAESDAHAIAVGAYYRLGLLSGIPMWLAESELP